MPDKTIQKHHSANSTTTDPDSALIFPQAARSTGRRQESWEVAQQTGFDVAILGGGINGACLYDRLSRLGYRVLLIDRGDFGCGTSQASGMMVWGGLLYLRNLDLITVYQLSKARDSMIKEMNGLVSSCPFRYILNTRSGRSRCLTQSALYLYWLLGLAKRKPPEFQNIFEENSLLQPHLREGSLIYEEGFLNISDCRFVLQWITPHQSPTNVALNYCSAEAGEFNSVDARWTLHLKDTLGDRRVSTRAGLVINCAGVWTDRVNRTFNISSPYKHVLSKGVYLGVKRSAQHRFPLIFEMGEHGDTLTYTPWGPVSLWGPTETAVNDIEEGFSVTEKDVRFLMQHLNKNLNIGIKKSDIVSLRCGIRPLAVKAHYDRDLYPLDLSRKQRVIPDSKVPWISIYGGKITGCISLAEKVAAMIGKTLAAPARRKPLLQCPTSSDITWASFPGLEEKVPSLDWCVKNEFCCTLEDYLRRRTNIAQWVPRQGLGEHDENRSHLEKLATRICDHNIQKEKMVLENYAEKVQSRFDRVLEKC